MFRWKRLGKVFDPTQREEKYWMAIYAQSPSPIVFEEYVRVYFSSREQADKDGQFVSRLGYIDLDRKDLFNIIGISQQPILPLGEKGTFDEFGTYPVSVIKVKNEIKAYYAGWTRCESVPFNAAIGLAESLDNGDSFKKIGPGPILSYTYDEPFVLGSPRIKKFGEVWYLWYSAGREWINTDSTPQPVYKIRMATSEDGTNWTKNKRNIISDVLEKNECQASADVFFYKDRYHMLFSYRYNLGYREEDRGYKIGYASSTDLYNWKRNDALAGLEKSKAGWDSESISYPNVFELDGKVYMFYQGNEMGKNGFGLMELIDYKDM